MAVNDGMVETILRYRVDQASLQAAIASTKAIEASIARPSEGVAVLNQRFEESRNQLRAMSQQQAAAATGFESIDDSIIGASEGTQVFREKIDAARESLQRLKDDQFAQEFQGLRDSISGAADATGGLGGGTGGGGGSFAALGPIGQKLRALPSVQIPGTGIGTDAIANILRLGPVLDTVAAKIPLVTTVTEALTPVLGATAAGFGGVLAVVALVAAPVVAFVVAFKVLGDTIAAGKKQVDDAVTALKSSTDIRQTEIETIRNSTSAQIKAATETAQAKLDELNIEKANREAFLADIQAQYAALGASFDPAKRAALGEAGQAAQQAIDDLTKRQSELTTTIDQNTNVILPAITAREKETAAIEAQNAASDQQVARLTSNAELVRTATAEQVSGQIAQLTEQNQAILTVINSGAASSEKINELSLTMQANRDKIVDLRDNVLALVTAHDAEIAATKEATQIRTDEIAATKQYNTDIQKIKDTEAQAEITLASKYADTQVKIAQKATEDAQKALDDLLNKQSALQLSLSRNLESAAANEQEKQLNRQIDFQRNEVAAAKQHEIDLANIQKQGQERDVELGLNRNFAALAASKRQTAQDLAASNDKFKQDDEARLQHYQDQNDDDQRQFIFERQQKLIKFGQDMADAQAAETKQLLLIRAEKNKQLQAATAAYNADLANLRAKLINEQAMKFAAVQAELTLISKGNAARLVLDQQYYDQATAIIQGKINAAGGSTSGSGVIGTGGGGGGGNFLPSASAASFSNASKFLPRAGGGGGNSNSVHLGGMSFNIQSNQNPQAIAAAIRPMVEDAIADTINRIHA